MPNLVEQSQWDSGIYQFQITDPIQGGPGGIDNLPHQNLVNRTRWLRDRIGAVVTQGGQTEGIADNQQLLETVILHVATTIQLKALPIPTVPGTQTVLVMTRGYQTEGDNLGLFYKWNATSTAADPGNGLIVIPNSNPASGRWVFVGIDANTLGGAGPAFYASAAQLAAAVAPLAPLASPAFSGAPTTPSPAARDSSARIPNTSWVTANFYANNQPVAQANQLLINGTGYASFFLLPVSGQPTYSFGSNDGVNVYVWNPSNFSVANSHTVDGAPLSVTPASSTLVCRDGNGYVYGVYLNQASQNNENPSISQFMVTNGDNFLRKANFAAVKSQLGILTSSDFPSSLSTNGYQKFPGGLIFQWGSASVNSGQSNVVDLGINFPISFPNGVFGVFPVTNRSVNVTGQATQGSNFSTSYSTNGAIISLDSVGNGVNAGRWFAIGF